MHFDGPVVPWYQMLQKSGAVSSWEVQAKAIETTYGPSLFESPRCALFKLLQEGTVTEYYHTFTGLPNRVTGLSSDAMLDYFISGLKKELQRDIIPWKPDSITRAVTLVRLYEDKYGFLDRHGRFKNQYIPDISAATRKQPLALPAPPSIPNKSLALPGPSTPVHPIKRMSYSELQDRRAK